MMQRCPQTPLSEGFKSLVRNDLRALKNGVRLNLKISIYYGLEFQN